MNLRLLSLSLTTFAWVGLAPNVFAQAGNDNPGGVTAEYHGSITTAGYYDPYTGNAKREVDDCFVAGSIGAYPLKYTRTFNTRGEGTWTHNYEWSLHVRPPDADPGHGDGFYDGPVRGIQYPNGGHFDTITYDSPWDVGANGPHGASEDLPRKTVEEIKKAMKDNIHRTQTEKSPDGPGGKPRHQEHRTMAYDNDKGERKTSTETGRHENGIYPYTEKPKNPFNTPATPAWDSHSHISGSGKPYAPHDFNSADRLGVPSGVQSATGGPLYIYVPSATRGGEGGLFRVEGVRLINDATGQEAPH
jgi:hypothetical protein